MSRRKAPLKSVGSSPENRARGPVVGWFDADGNFTESNVTADEFNQIELLMRYGTLAAQQGKELEESQQIGATALQLIQKLKSPPEPIDSQEPA